LGDIAVNNTVFAGLPISFHGFGAAKIFFETSKNGRKQIFHFNDELPNVGGLSINLPDIIDVHGAK
jgi:hypothetical protein